MLQQNWACPLTMMGSPRLASDIEITESVRLEVISRLQTSYKPGMIEALDTNDAK
jgi:hypothetical protein